MTAILIFNTALDAAVSSIILGLCMWASVADACGLRTVAIPLRRRARWLRLERAAVGAT